LILARPTEVDTLHGTSQVEHHEDAPLNY